MEWTTEIKREWNQTLLQCWTQGGGEDTYHTRMLKENTLRNLLVMHEREIEGKTVYEYDICGKISMKNRFERTKLDAEEMKKFLKSVQSALEEVAEYLLNPNSLLLDVEHIYWENDRYYFCYMPGQEGDIWLAFHKIMDFFVQWTDYQDLTSVKLAFLLHKETMDENYSLKKIEAKMQEMEEQETVVEICECRLTEEKEEIDPIDGSESRGSIRRIDNYEIPVEYDMITDGPAEGADWITAQEMGSRILRETDHMWIPVKQFLQKHKRPKWGEWDGIYVEEEEL